MQRSGGQLLVECLLAQGAEMGFGVPGESYLAVLDALYDVQDRFRLITTRHEGGAAFAAEAYGKLTGRPGICFVTRGPGVTNASIGIHTAHQDSVPMVVFVGQVGRHMRDREAFQELNYRAVFGTMAKWVTEIDQADRIPELVARAFSVAVSGRPGPVVVALPEDMLRDMTDAAPVVATPVAAPQPDPHAISEAAALLNTAKRPLMLLGSAIWSSEDRATLANFAKHSGIAIAPVFRCQDAIDHRLENFIGDAGVGMKPHVRQAIEDADVILALNIRFGECATDGWTLLDVPKATQKIIHSHLSADEIGKIYQPDVGMVAAPAAVLKALSPLLTKNHADGARAIHQKYLQSLTPPASVGPVDMSIICSHLREVLEPDAIITNGAGNFAIWSGRHLQYHSDMRLIAPQSGAMGAGIPAALAAKALYPERQVVCFAGDGDFQMTSAELGSAAQHGAQPIILVLNNGTYGTIRMHQVRDYPGRVSGTEIINPDFAALARAYGFVGTRVQRTEEFAYAFAEACASKTGAVIELVIDPRDVVPGRATED